MHESIIPWDGVDNCSQSIKNGLFIKLFNKSIYFKCFLSVMISQANLRLFITAKGLQEEENILFEWDIGPVSYTHLDVYKRQVLARAYARTHTHTHPTKIWYFSINSDKKYIIVLKLLSLSAT